MTSVMSLGWMLAIADHAEPNSLGGLDRACWRIMATIDPHERWKPHGRPEDAGLQSFGGRPYTESVDDLDGVDVAVVGAPLDELVTDLPGARLGPRAIRIASDGSGGVHLDAGVDSSRRFAWWTSATRR